MKNISLKESFLRLCDEKKFEKNINQIEIIESLQNFIKPRTNFFDFFNKPKEKLCFYLFGGVGLGKTMISDHFFDYIQISKKRSHFNEFMISFHDFKHVNKSNSLAKFVKRLKKYDLIYLDELQVTNIVDAMILGKLFESIFFENIKVLITSNIKIDDLYKDGLQRDQFLPFISIIKKNSIQKELFINEDYRMTTSNKLQRAFIIDNEKILFQFNQMFRKLTKNKKKDRITLNVKGRNLIIPNFYEGIAKFDFKYLCDDNLGAEDYINIANACKFVVIENIPIFNDENVNQQQRFITLIDIFYEKKILLMISLKTNLENLASSKKLFKPFKRTLSRLYELTSSNDKLS